MGSYDIEVDENSLAQKHRSNETDRLERMERLAETLSSYGAYYGCPFKICMELEACTEKAAESALVCELCWVGLQLIYVCKPPNLVVANELLFIVVEIVDFEVYFVAYQGRSVAGELEERSAVLRTQEHFWEAGVHQWEINDAEKRASYDLEWLVPEWTGKFVAYLTRQAL